MSATIDELFTQLALAERDERVDGRRADRAYANNRFAAGRAATQHAREAASRVRFYRTRIEDEVRFQPVGTACEWDLYWL